MLTIREFLLPGAVIIIITNNFIIFVTVIFLAFSSIASAEGIAKFYLAGKKDGKLYSAIHDVYREAFAQIGFDFQASPCVPKTCSQMKMDEAIVGEGARQRGYDQLQNRLDRIDIDIFTIKTIAFTRKSDQPNLLLKDLANDTRKVAYQQGFDGYRKMLVSLRGDNSVIESVHWEYGLKKLLNGDIDMYVGSEQIIIPELSAKDLKNYSIEHIEDADFKEYPYIGKDFSEYSEIIKKALVEMKAKGRINSIFEHYGVSTGQ
ncbi:MAG: ABC-type amino acid transport substrate-binding protein [Oceanicoccus sp.]|jgi:ABC-type amino acid transport substrate-binding protein